MLSMQCAHRCSVGPLEPPNLDEDPKSFDGYKAWEVGVSEFPAEHPLICLTLDFPQVGLTYSYLAGRFTADYIFQVRTF